MYSSCYRWIHLLKFVSCYCALICNEYVIVLCFIINHHKTLLISQIIMKKICLSQKFRINSFRDISKGHVFAADTEYSTFSKSSGIYCGSADSASYFYNRKVLVYNVYLANNTYGYGEVSIFILFLIAKDTF